jgi:hypothetical protein
MGHHKLYYHDGVRVRTRLNEAVDLATQIHEQEQCLVELLRRIDRNQLYLRYGYRSLRGFCQFGLRFSKTQAQRIATQVRRSIPTANIADGKAERNLMDDSKVEPPFEMGVGNASAAPTERGGERWQNVQPVGG